MNNTTKIIAVACLATVAAPAHAALYFSDTYDTVGNNNDINAGIGARTSGSVSVTSYNEVGSPWQTQLRDTNGGVLLLAPNDGGGSTVVWAGPDHDFSAELGGYYEISFDVNPNDHSGAWAGFTFGVNGANQGADVTANHGGLSLRLWENDNWEIYDGTDASVTAVKSGNHVATDFRTVLLEVTDSGANVTVDLSIDDVFQDSYTYTGSFAGNYLAFSASTDRNNTDSSYFDNLTIVPEPSTTALLGLGGLALILRRRK